MTAPDPGVERARRETAGLVDGDDPVRAVDAYARASWTALVEPGDRVAGALVDALGPRRALSVALSDGDATAAARSAGLDTDEVLRGRRRWMPRSGDIDGVLERARRARVRLVTPEDPLWPARLADLGPYAPLCLWVRGDLEVLGRPEAGVAIVGARAATAYGTHVAAELAAECGAAGIAVYSGAAYGIDAVAHEAALRAGGPTVAVMAGGVDRAYPAGNLRLIDEIAARGAVLSEMPCGSTPSKHRFLARNRVIAALSDATVVVEAGWRSGALNTAHHAQAIGRPVGAVPGPVTSAASMGCHRLLREGEAVCVTGPDDVRELIGLDGSLAACATEGFTDERVRVLDALSVRTARQAEDVARRAGVAPEEAVALLGLLALEGRVRRQGSGWLQLGKVAPAPATLW